ncbi:MAG: hypothetical protein ACFE0Q_21260 [Anaerolineae bacterium]
MPPTPTSLLLRDHARAIAMTCPPTLYDEIALVGSSARGIATETSDLDINIWTRTLPPLSARQRWLRSIGVVSVHSRPPNADGSQWLSGTYQQIALEIGWQTLTDFERTMEAIVSGQVIDHHTLRLAELFLSAHRLRGRAVLNNWQTRLYHYPPALAERLITDALSGWCDGKQARSDHLHRIWRVLFALNQQWEINWKYALFYMPNLPLRPPDLAERIAHIQQVNSTEADTILQSLIVDTLRLVVDNRGASPLLRRTLSYCESLRNDCIE